MTTEKSYLPEGRTGDARLWGVDCQKDIAPHGFVRLVRVDGDDDFIARSARHGKESDNPTENLLRFMMRHKHTTPFETVGLVFHIKCPIFVERQIRTHRTATTNELSMRYERAKEEFWLPAEGKWREQSENNHQGSSDKTVDYSPDLYVHDGPKAQGYKSAEGIAFREYGLRCEAGVSREQARSCLPVSIYTEFFWKVDLHNLFHFLKLRLDPHAQAEMREFAQAIEQFAKAVFPIAYAAWVDYVRDAMTLTVYDIRALLARKEGMFLLAEEGMFLLAERESLFPSKREEEEFEAKWLRIQNAGR